MPRLFSRSYLHETRKILAGPGVPGVPDAGRTGMRPVITGRRFPSLDTESPEVLLPHILCYSDPSILLRPLIPHSRALQMASIMSPLPDNPVPSRQDPAWAGITEPRHNSRRDWHLIARVLCAWAADCFSEHALTRPSGIILTTTFFVIRCLAKVTNRWHPLFLEDCLSSPPALTLMSLCLANQ